MCSRYRHAPPRVKPATAPSCCDLSTPNAAVICLVPMANKKNTEQAKEAGGGEILQEAAKAIGSALGTIVKKAGLAHTEKPTKASGKLVKRAKKRLPRKEKKQAKKLLGRSKKSSAK